MKTRINSRTKGIAGELEAIKLVQSFGYATSQRMIQPRGGKVDGPDFYVLNWGQNAAAVEVKRDAAVKPWTKGMVSAMRQAANTPEDLPTMVLFRRNREPWGMCCGMRVDGHAAVVCAYGSEIENLIAMLLPNVTRKLS